MANYHKGKIYKLVSIEDGSMFYIGSTCKTLCARKTQHRCDEKKYTSRPLYKYSSSIGGIDQMQMVLIENFSCTSKKELNTREMFFITQLMPPLNKQNITKTYENVKKKKKEHYQINKKAILAKMHENYVANSEPKKARVKAYKLRHKDSYEIQHFCGCGGTYIKQHKAAHEKTKKHCRWLQQQQQQ